MADINLKTETPDTSLPTTGFLFGADSQAVSSPSVYTTQAVATTLLGSTTLSGATITADAPVLNMSQTWNNAAVTFTGLKFNATDTASNAASLLMDLQVGGTSQFSVSKTGALQLKSGGSLQVYAQGRAGFAFTVYNASDNGIFDVQAGNLSISRSANLGWSSSATTVVAGQDLILRRKTAANLAFGAADAAAPVAQTLSVQSVVAGTTNIAGANLTITGSQGTGTGAGGSIIFQVAPAGSSGTAQNALSTALTIFSDQRVNFKAGSVSAPAIMFGTNTPGAGNIGVYQRSNAAITISDANSVNLFEFQNVSGGNGVFNLNSTGSLQWCSGGAGSTGGDTILARDDANILALRNGANAQAFRAYNTYTDASNFERLSIGWSSNVARVGINTSGTGVTRDLVFGTGGGSQWAINTSGHWVTYGSDNTYDIGASGASRPRTVYVGTDIHLGQYIRQATNLLYIVNGAGILQLSNASNTDFGRLQFGGTTSSFPALKRSSTTLQVVLANDGGFTNIQGKLTTDTAYTAGSIVPTGYLTLYDSTGTAYRVPCVV